MTLPEKTQNDLGTASAVLNAGHGRPVAGRVVLDYDARCLRRKRLVTEAGDSFLVDLPQVISLPPGAAFALADGRVVEVVEAREQLLRITGDLPRLAWHIGNRHCPCQMGGDHLVIRADPVLEAMLVQLGARLTRSFAPFRPEGGAYGHGRTFGHSH
ncbi:urease accessory protein UreE [Paracoccus jiaweipingae]|uniref:urease accessory protein UreE n=1 Tax=unclassified Paracoccus (in: a-proteobacteria) TaxID=2688777 RepID=UPI0037ADDEE8